MRTSFELQLTRVEVSSAFSFSDFFLMLQSCMCLYRGSLESEGDASSRLVAVFTLIVKTVAVERSRYSIHVSGDIVSCETREG